MKYRSTSRPEPRARSGADAGFSLLELTVVICIIVIVAAIVSPLVPGLLKGDRIDSDVTTLSGILEEAREAATAGNTYVWVAFTDASAASSPSVGTWVAVFQSQDGTETGINSGTSTSPVWSGTITIPSSNLALHSKLQNLPGVQIDVGTSASTGTFTGSKASATLLAKAPSGATTLQSVTQWNVTNLVNTGMASTVYFTHALEFTPNGEAHVTTWNSNIEFGMYPTTGSTANYVLFDVTRLTGKVSTFRP